MARFQTTGKFQNVRIPYNAFRRVSSQEEGLTPGPAQPMQPETIRKLALVVENRNRQSRGAGGRGGGRGQADVVESISRTKDNIFKLELNRIHVSSSWTFSDGV